MINHAGQPVDAILRFKQLQSWKKKSWPRVACSSWLLMVAASRSSSQPSAADISLIIKTSWPAPATALSKCCSDPHKMPSVYWLRLYLCKSAFSGVRESDHSQTLLSVIVKILQFLKLTSPPPDTDHSLSSYFQFIKLWASDQKNCRERRMKRLHLDLQR